MAGGESFFNSFESLAVASEWNPVEEARPINVPIFSSSTFKLSSVAHAEELATGKVSEVKFKCQCPLDRSTAFRAGKKFSFKL